MRTYWRLLAALLGAIMLAVILHGWFRTREPVVNGKPISFWLDAGRRGSGEAAGGIGSAYRAMDEECVRWLAGELEWKPNRIRDSTASVVNRFFGDTMSRTTPGDRRIAAAVVLGNLGERALPAVPALRKVAQTNVRLQSLWVRAAATTALIRLGHEPIGTYLTALDDTSNTVRWRETVYALEGLGTNAAPAVPVLAAMLVSNNLLTVRFDAVRFLGAVGIDPDLSVPALINAIEEPRIRRSALISLSRFGVAASNATEIVVACLSDTNVGVRVEAERTLRAINPKRASLLTNSPAQ
jgi:HEAT repeat protein